MLPHIPALWLLHPCFIQAAAPAHVQPLWWSHVSPAAARANWLSAARRRGWSPRTDGTTSPSNSSYVIR